MEIVNPPTAISFRQVAATLGAPLASTNAYSDILSLDLGTLKVGQLILVTWGWWVDGLAAQTVSLQFLRTAGTGNIIYGGTSTAAMQTFLRSLTGTYAGVLCQAGRVSTAGAYTLGCQGSISGAAVNWADTFTKAQVLILGS